MSPVSTISDELVKIGQIGNAFETEKAADEIALLLTLEDITFLLDKLSLKERELTIGIMAVLASKKMRREIILNPEVFLLLDQFLESVCNDEMDDTDPVIRRGTCLFGYLSLIIIENDRLKIKKLSISPDFPSLEQEEQKFVRFYDLSASLFSAKIDFSLEVTLLTEELASVESNDDLFRYLMELKPLFQKCVYAYLDGVSNPIRTLLMGFQTPSR